jgi:hypothetical protein
MIDPNYIKGLIDSNYNCYFKCADLVNDVIAERNNVTVKDLMDCRKRTLDPFDKFRRGLNRQIAHALLKLKENGDIEKYGRYVWRIVK